MKIMYKIVGKRKLLIIFDLSFRHSKFRGSHESLRDAMPRRSSLGDGHKAKDMQKKTCFVLENEEETRNVEITIPTISTSLGVPQRLEIVVDSAESNHRLKRMNACEEV